MVILFAAAHKFFSDVAIAQVKETAAKLAGFMDDQYIELLKEIKEKGVVSDDMKKTLARAFEEFRLAHAELFTEAK